MRVKLLTTMAGPDGCHHPGSTPDLPEKQAKELIEGLFAVPVDEDEARAAKRAKPKPK